MRIIKKVGLTPIFSRALQPYFRPATRGSIRLSSGERVRLDIVLSESYFAKWSPDRQFGTSLETSHGLLVSPINYEDLLVRFERKPDTLNLIIQYGIREKRGSLFLYSVIAGRRTKRPPVVITYDKKSVFADGVEFDTKLMTVRTNGDVLVTENGETMMAKLVTIRISNGKVRFDIKRAPSDPRLQN